MLKVRESEKMALRKFSGGRLQRMLRDSEGTLDMSEKLTCMIVFMKA